MAWLYVPDMQGSSSVCTLPSAVDTELWVTSSGKPMPRPLSWRGWKTRPWIGRLCGTISNPSMAARGVESWISCLAATRASRSVSPERSLAQRIQDTCGLTFTALCERSALDGFSSRTSQLTLLADSTPCFETFTALVTALRQASLARRKSARAICGSGYSSSENWPTANANPEAPNNSTNRGKDYGGERARKTDQCLSSRARNWPTADACVLERDNQSPSAGAAVRPTLAKASANWPTARAEDSEQTGGHRGTADTLTSATAGWSSPTAHDGRPGEDRHSTQGGNLSRDASAWATPQAHDAAAGNPDRVGRFGTAAADDGHKVVPSSAQPGLIGASHSFRLDPENETPGGASSIGARKLNPLFVEWLMGWPLQWTDCGAVATGSFHWWRQRHLCALRGILRQGDGSNFGEVA